MKSIIKFISGYSSEERAVVVFCLVMLLLTVPLILVTGPAHAQSGNVYGNAQAQVAGPTETAVVVQVQFKQTEPAWQLRTAGAGIGGALGGLLANQVNGNARYAANILGVTVGGLLGERVATSTMSEQAQEVILQVAGSNGQPPRILTIVQPAPFDRLVAGEYVYLINTAGKYRVVRQVEQNASQPM